MIKIGEKFNNWIAIDNSFRDKNKSGNQYFVKCQCLCGTIKLVRMDGLKTGYSTSCGCTKATTIGSKNTKHGGSSTRLYGVWKCMKARCKGINKNHKSYKHYCGKGIKVCDEWLEFSLFREWAMKNGYADNLCIDRIDSNKDYCPENCQWLTPSENSRRIIGYRDELIINQKIKILELEKEIEELKKTLARKEIST